MKRFTTKINGAEVKVIDNESGITCTFEILKFNETQKFDWSNINKSTPITPGNIAKICREFGDYLVAEYPELVY